MAAVAVAVPSPLKSDIDLKVIASISDISLKFKGSFRQQVITMKQKLEVQEGCHNSALGGGRDNI